jgi:peptide/nickel transport system permease protein
VIWRISAIGTLLFLGIVVIVPELLAPYAYSEQDRDLALAPPTQVHFFDAKGQFHPRPFVYALRTGSEGEYQEDKDVRYPLQFFVRSLPGTSSRNTGLHLFGVEKPARASFCGRDELGRDLLSRIIYGTRVTLTAGLLATSLALMLGVIFGVFSGYFGGWTDMVLMRFVELFLSLPWLYLLLAVRSILPLDTKNLRVFFVFVALLGFIGWARPARLVRGAVLSARQKDFVLSAVAMGASRWHILWKHILPQTYPLVVTIGSLLLPQFIISELTLTYLGLGVAEPVPSWGNLLADAQRYSVLTSHRWILLPVGYLIVLFVLFQYLGTRLERAEGWSDL